ELCHAVEAELGVAPAVAELLSGCSIAEAAREVARLVALGRSAPPRAAPDGRADDPTASPTPAPHPLPLGPQALWILHGLAPTSAAYTIAGAARLVEGVDPAALGCAFQALVARHPALRTTFAQGPEGPFQRVHAPAAQAGAAWVLEDASGWSGE